MKYDIIITTAFKTKLKIIKKRNLKLDKLTKVVNDLAMGKTLDARYRNHQLLTLKDL